MLEMVLRTIPLCVSSFYKRQLKLILHYQDLALVRNAADGCNPKVSADSLSRSRLRHVIIVV